MLGQGIEIVVPRDLGEPVEGEVLVAPPPSDPLYAAYRPLIESFEGRIVSDESPRRALFRALSRETGFFKDLVVGVDPGRLCAMAALGDGLVIWVWKGLCSSLGSEVERLMADAPYKSLRAFLGAGPGYLEALKALESLSLPVAIVEESGSTSSPYGVPGGLSGVVRDEDVLAALTIAYKGLSDWLTLA